MADDNGNPDLLRRLVDIFTVAASVIAIIVFIKTPSYRTYVFPLVLVILILLLSVYWKPFKSIISTLGVRLLHWRSRLKKIRWWGWSSIGMAALSLFLLSYLWKSRQPTSGITILVADFHQIYTESDPNAVTEKLVYELRAALSGEPDANVVSLRQHISPKDSPDFVHELGEEYDATIIIWGAYTVTTEMVDIWVYFAVLDELALLPSEIQSTGKVGMEALFGLNGWENLESRDQVVDELTYLTLFTLGLARYEAGEFELANAHFSRALSHVEQSLHTEHLLDSSESPMLLVPLKRCVVYFHRGKAYYEKESYDQAISDFDQAIALCPDYAAAYENRGSVYYIIGDGSQAIADWSKGEKLQKELAPVH